MTSRLQQAANDIDAAQGAVAKASIAYSRGASADVVVKANAKLADAQARYREINDGRVPDDR